MIESLIVISGLLVLIVSVFLALARIEAAAIRAEKRRYYLDFVKSLPDINDICNVSEHTEFEELLRPAAQRLNSLVLYSDPTMVTLAGRLLQSYREAREELTPETSPLAPEYRDLAEAQNDLIWEMRRDAFDTSIPSRPWRL